MMTAERALIFMFANPVQKADLRRYGLEGNSLNWV